MAYIFSDHAKRRMRQRGITETQVQETVATPEIKYPDKIKDRWIHKRRYGQRELKVVLIPQNGDVYIVTAYWV